MVYGIIMASGKGSRMNSNIPKQYMILDDKPILISRTYSLFQAINYIVNNVKTSNEDIAVIHDADRPFVSDEVLIDCIDKAKRYKATLAVTPYEETMYIIDNKGFFSRQHWKGYNQNRAKSIC